MSKLSTERLFLFDPYNEEHLNMLKDFEIRNDIIPKMSEQIEKLHSSVSKETYLLEKKEKNEIEENLFLEKEAKIIDMCHLHVEKDIRLGHINMAPVKTKERVRKLIPYVNNYAFNTLNVEEIFIETSQEDKSLQSYLDSEGYESLGEQEGKIIYLKEKEELRDVSSIVHSMK